jgi:hypothetical protein
MWETMVGSPRIARTASGCAALPPLRRCGGRGDNSTVVHTRGENLAGPVEWLRSSTPDPHRIHTRTPGYAQAVDMANGESGLVSRAPNEPQRCSGRQATDRKRRGVNRHAIHPAPRFVQELRRRRQRPFPISPFQFCTMSTRRRTPAPEPPLLIYPEPFDGMPLPAMSRCTQG